MTSATPGPLSRHDGGMTFGVMLPHFGPHATAERLLRAGTLVERLGFDAVWVRDHLLWRPHAHEARQSIRFVEPLITLAALGARTERILLGTAVLIPIRQPLKLAQELAALSFLTGDRVVVGVGAGHDRAELLAGGVDPSRRRQAAIEMIRILRLALGEGRVSYAGEVYRIEEAALEPIPARRVPILFGGPSRIAVDVAVGEADGYIVGTQPFLTMDDRLAYLREREAALGRRLALVSVPRVYVDADRARARAAVNVAGLVEDGRHHWVRPPSGWWQGFEDVEGAVFAGEPLDIVEGVLKLRERGFDHFVFDVRFQFDRFEAMLELIAERILPELRPVSADAPKSGGRT
ncbi:MAG TPA: LLM class flavin-dependent oxidoreductase [Candidatus Limnocylindrales bacterium]|nr:LLM class flavin-dependent oxidoreductase [Candidatus Limnocylindrales bacterium]